MEGSLFQWIVFFAMAFLAIFCALMVVTRRNPIHSAVFLIVNFFAIAVIYLLLGSQFIAIAQVMVYAGAIMMLVVFTIMLISVEEARRVPMVRLSAGKVFGVILAVLLFVELLYGLMVKALPGKVGPFTPERLQAVGPVRTVGGLLMSKYLLAFELASVVLLIGIIGAVILAKKER